MLYLKVNIDVLLCKPYRSGWFCIWKLKQTSNIFRDRITRVEREMVAESKAHVTRRQGLLFDSCWEQICLRYITVVPPYLRVIRSKTYPRYVKPRIIPNAIYNVIIV
jgi:hypothetical protein